MARPTMVDTLLDVARKRIDHAARSLASLHAKEHDAEQQLQMLLAYRDEYFTRFHESAAKGIGHDTLRNFHAFMQKLDAAIEEQRKVVADMRHGVHAGQDHWRAEHQRLKSYDILAERDRSAETRRVRRREQQEQDEHAAKAYRQKKASA